MTFEEAKGTLRCWTSVTAGALRDGIAKLEALVEELKTGLQTVRRERDEALEKNRTLRSKAERLETQLLDVERARDNALVEHGRVAKERDDLIRRLDSLRASNARLIISGNRVLHELERAETPGMQLAPYVLEEQARQVVNELLDLRRFTDTETARADHNFKQGVENTQKAAALAARLREERDAAKAAVERLQKRVDAAETNTDIERMRLAACGVVANANTPETAAKAREMHPDYRSASCDDVARAVDREMTLREANDALHRINDSLRRELETAEARIATLKAQDQPLDLVLVDRKGFERKISMRRKDAGPQILVPGPSGERISFRFQYGNLYREQW